MSQKRQPDDGNVGSEANSPEEKRRRVPALRNVILEVMKMNAFQTLVSTLEPLIRRVVKEELELALRKNLASLKESCDNSIYPPMSKSLQLQFTNRLSLPVFTGALIEGEECSALKVAIVDSLTGHVVNSGPGSLVKVEIVVLEGDFEGHDDNCTFEEFKNNIVKERESKRPLLSGNAVLTLNEGTGVVRNLVFTDNSSWTKSRKFRLGARVMDGCDGIRVREAKTEPFVVKDHRGELYKKHYPPSLDDEVWRLEKIGKDGAFHKRLLKENINTVKDFLTLLHVDTPRLRNVLGNGMSAKMWEAVVDHARTCLLDKLMYLYCPPSSQEKMSVVFNVVGQILGLFAESQFTPLDSLSETQKVDAHKLVKAAYEHWEEVVSCDDEFNNVGFSTSPGISVLPGSPEVESSYSCKFSSSCRSGGFDFTQPSVSSPTIASSILSFDDMRSFDNYNLHDLEHMDISCDHASSLRSQVISSICDTELVVCTFGDNEHYQCFDSNTSSQSRNFSLGPHSDPQNADNGFIATSCKSAAAAATDNKAQTRWKMLFSLFRWRFSIRRIMASKKSGVWKRRDNLDSILERLDHGCKDSTNR